MSKTVWGPITWRFLHTFAAKVKESEFQNQRSNIMLVITNVCSVLPCPSCREHAMQNLRLANVNRIQSKQHLIDFLHEFHNRVNMQTGKPVQSKLILQQYEHTSLVEVTNTFCRSFLTNYGSFKLMSDAMMRQRTIRHLVQYMQSNKNSFILS
jgi:hypothetical protein